MTGSDMPASTVRRSGEGQQRWFYGGGVHTWLALAEETGGAFLLFEDAMDNGKRTPLHTHPEADETMYVLQGEIVMHLDGPSTGSVLAALRWRRGESPTRFWSQRTAPDCCACRLPAVAKPSTLVRASRSPTVPTKSWTSAALRSPAQRTAGSRSSARRPSSSCRPEAAHTTAPGRGDVEAGLTARLVTR